MTVYKSNTAYLSVTVVDVADLDPQFLGEPYLGSVPENCPLVRCIYSALLVLAFKCLNLSFLTGLILIQKSCHICDRSWL